MPLGTRQGSLWGLTESAYGAPGAGEIAEVWRANSFLANRKLLGPGSPEVCGKFGFVSGKSGTTSYGSSSEAGGRGWYPEGLGSNGQTQP